LKTFYSKIILYLFRNELTIGSKCYVMTLSGHMHTRMYLLEQSLVVSDRTV